MLYSAYYLHIKTHIFPHSRNVPKKIIFIYLIHARRSYYSYVVAAVCTAVTSLFSFGISPRMNFISCKLIGILYEHVGSVILRLSLRSPLLFCCWSCYFAINIVIIIIVVIMIMIVMIRIIVINVLLSSSLRYLFYHLE